MNNIQYVDNLASFTTTVDNNDNELIKKGLLFYEGEATCNKGNKFNITKDRIYSLVENTNKYLEGATIKMFKEHNKHFDNEIGEINKPLIAKTITEDDVKVNPKFKPLIGKIGIFTNEAIIRAKDVIEKLANKIGGSVSCGIDFDNNIIRELSLVGLPSLPSATLFNLQDNITYLTPTNKITKFNMNNPDAITLEDALAEGQKQEELEEEAEQLLDIFIKVVCNLKSKSDEELAQLGTDKKTAFDTSLQQLTAKLTEMFDPTAQDQAMQQQAVNPMMPNTTQQPQAQYNLDEVLANFNGSTVEELEEYLAEFGLLGTLGKKIGARVASGVAAAGKQTGLLNKAKGFAGASTSGLGQKIGAGLNNASSAIKSGVKSGLTTATNTVQKGLGKAALTLKKSNNSMAKSAGTQLGKAAMGLNKARKEGKIKFNNKTKLTKFSK